LAICDAISLHNAKALKLMNRYGVLERYIPAFGKITGLMQYDLFHAYTVDQHTLFVIRNLRRFFVGEFAKEFALCSEIASHIAKPELLFLASCFCATCVINKWCSTKLDTKAISLVLRLWCLRKSCASFAPKVA
jgi:hypothetical protein